MRKTLLFIFFSIVTFAQVPQGISHRGTAYNTLGNVLINTNISVRVRILDGSVSGTIVYEEKHNKTTNGSGQYNFNIGQGTPQGSYSFNEINWSTNNKFLEIGIDPNNGTNYSVVGSSQLMSVPYALYAKNVDLSSNNSPILSVNTINDLRTSVFHQGNIKTVYVKYHTSLNDGGGGFFYWVAETPDTNKYLDNDGTIIKPINYSGNGRWLRKIDSFIDVRFFGCLGHSQPDDGLKIQKAIDFAANNYSDNFFTKGNTVFLRNGAYKCNKIILKKGITLKGESKEFTSIGSVNDNNPYLIEIDSGVVENIIIENINFIALESNLNYTKGCFNIKAKSNSSIGGGLWNSVFINLRITRFTGNSINFEGGGEGSNYALTNQFITLENVEAEGVGNIRQSTYNLFYPAVLRIAGQNGQFVFTNCRFDGGPYLFGSTSSIPSYKVNGMNVYIGSISADYNNINDRIFYPECISFKTCTFQSGELGFYIQSGQNINVTDSWFENFERAIIIKGNSCDGDLSINGCVRSKQINITGNKFLYSAGRYGFSDVPVGSGCVIVVENALANIHNNYIIDPTQDEETYFVSVEGNNVIGVDLKNNYFDPPKLGKTRGVIKKTTISQINVNGLLYSGIKALSNKIIFIQNSTTTTTGLVYRIDSTINTGENIFIKADKGNITFYPLNSVTGTPGRNIYLNGRASLTLNQGQGAMFIKTDNVLGVEYETYHLLYISN